MKQNLKNFIINPFSILFIIGLIAGLVPLIIFEKGEIVLWVNRRFAENKYDIFYSYFTELGHGLIFVLFTIIQLFLNTRKAYQTAITGIIILIVSQILKHIFVEPRPTALLPHESFAHIIDGFEYAKNYSFPSGHTMTIFGFFAIMSYHCYSVSLRVIGFITAALVGFSRMYLLQHFYIDVYFGALLGVCCALLSVAFFSNAKYIPIRGIFAQDNAELSE